MLITVRCQEVSPEDELRSLSAWLEADRTVVRHIQVEPTSELPRLPGQQGDGIDVLSLVLGTGFNAASLATAIACWRATRSQPPTLVVERSDGTRVEIHGSSQAEVQALVNGLLTGEQSDSGS
ncbi:hypothetical protein ACFCXA_12720 [Streptomyces virginiae]|uniref:effector-associated constant component EACC1 n=1 Tax=Streptomyces virginiae TaxID=1961 RepID=UPI003251F79B